MNKKIRILIDARWLCERKTGVGVYSENLLFHFNQKYQNAFYLLNKNCNSTIEFKNTILTKIRLSSHPATEIFEQFFIPFLCWKHKCRAFLSLENRVPILKIGIKNFSVIYDITTWSVKGSHNLKYSIYMKVNFWVSIIFSSKILTISKTVKNQICNNYKINENKIDVIYPSNSNILKYTSEEIPFLEGKNFFLMVGVTNKRKNFEMSIESFKNFKKQFPDWYLVVTGDEKLIDGIWKSYGYEKNVINLGFVTNPKLKFLYENCMALLYPSQEEGFGIPILDAYLFEKIILCSNLEVFKELTLNPKQMFDLKNKIEFSQLMIDVAKNNIRFSPTKIRFSWEDSANELIRVINE